MQPIDASRRAVDVAADLLRRAGTGETRPTDSTAQGLLDLLRERLRATESGAHALAHLEHQPTSEPARQAAAAELAAAIRVDPALAGQLNDRLVWVHSQQQPVAFGPGFPAPPTAPPRGGGSLVGIIVAVVVGVVLLGVGGVVAVVLATSDGSVTPEPDAPWQEQAAGIEGIVNYRQTHPEMLTVQHRTGPIDYPVSPPVGGDHNNYWQNCQGDIYDAPIADEHAVHSLEHGAVWITYDPALPAEQVDLLAERVRGNDYLFLSPYPGLPAPISLQAWGYRLTVPDAQDRRIDEFIRILRTNAGLEPGATCGGGVTSTGTAPLDEPGDAPARATGECAWLLDDAAANPHLRDVGTPPPGEPRDGMAVITITTSRGVIEVEMDTADVPCTAASLTHLAANGFYDGTVCHRLVTEGIYVLQCGDPTDTGMGGPTYRFAEENLPVDQDPTYPAGVVAMAKTAAPATTGSQFFIVYEDTRLAPEYTVVGKVSDGLEIVERVAADGHDGAFGESAGGGRPNTALVIDALRVSGPR